jgi:hypothetical protein
LNLLFDFNKERSIKMPLENSVVESIKDFICYKLERNQILSFGNCIAGLDNDALPDNGDVLFEYVDKALESLPEFTVFYIECEDDLYSRNGKCWFIVRKGSVLGQVNNFSVTIK